MSATAVANKGVVAANEGAADCGTATSAQDNTSDTFVLNKDSVFIDADIHSQNELFRFVGQKAQELGITANAASLEAELRKREEALSTGLMDGFAIPHAKTDLVVRPAVLYIRTKERVAWKMLEGEGAQHFFVMLVPTRDANTEHLQMLSKIAVCLLEEDFRDKISRIGSAEEMADYLRKSLKAE